MASQPTKWPVSNRVYRVYTCYACHAATNRAIGYTDHLVGSLGTQRYIHYHYCLPCAQRLWHEGKLTGITADDYNAALLRAMSDG